MCKKGLYSVPAPAKGFGGAEFRLLEVIAMIPFQGAGDGWNLMQYLVLLCDALLNACKYRVPGFCFLVSQAQVDRICQQGILPGIVQPARKPDGGGGGSYGCESVCVIGGPE